MNDSEKTIGSIYATSGSELSDSVLGVQIINGKGDLLNFGGQVMKNVAGYDVSQGSLVGSLGKLGCDYPDQFQGSPRASCSSRVRS